MTSTFHKSGNLLLVRSNKLQVSNVSKCWIFYLRWNWGSTICGSDGSCDEAPPIGLLWRHFVGSSASENWTLLIHLEDERFETVVRLTNWLPIKAVCLDDICTGQQISFVYISNNGWLRYVEQVVVVLYQFFNMSELSSSIILLL